MRTYILVALTSLFVGYLLLGALHPWALLYASPLALLCLLGFYDAWQKEDSVQRGFPLLGRLSRLLESQKHVVQELLLLNRREGAPFDQIHKEIATKRAEDSLTNQPFGTDYDLRADGIDFVRHSLFPTDEEDMYRDHRFSIGGPSCTKPYECSLLNVSGMSYGSISPEAITALAKGASRGHFALNTGEGGYADYHGTDNADVIFQFGTGYFGCRTKEGRFDPDKFRDIVVRDNVRMVEIKLNQGAKPGYGAILPASKNSEEIAKVRDIEPNETVESPRYHQEFRDPDGLSRFIGRVRDLSEGKPVGIKFCLGREEEMESLAMAFQKGEAPDYIVVDGAEGGTGAAHFESLHFTGMPLALSLPIVNGV